MKALLRLTPMTEKALRPKISIKQLSLNKLLEKSVRNFFRVAISQDFKEAYSLGLNSLQAARWSRRAELSGLLSKEKVSTKDRVRVGTVISAETHEQLKLLMAWSGKTRQSIIDTCLARFLDTANAPRPKGDDLSKFFYPLLSGSRRLTHTRLRWLVEHEFV